MEAASTKEELEKVRAAIVEPGSLKEEGQAMSEIRIEPGHTLEAESLLDSRIEVSPFMEFVNEWGSPIWIRKSAVIAVKSGGRSSAFRSSVDPSCTIFTTAGEFMVSHSALEVLEALGQGEL